MGWVTREQPVQDPATTRRAVASTVMRESRRYAKALQQRLLLGVAVTGGVLAYCMVASALIRTQGASTTMEVRPLSSATLVGVYAGLGAVVLGLQFASRTGLDLDGTDRRATARLVVQRSFLGALAWTALLASIGVGVVAIVWYSGFPRIDLARTAGPALASVFLAYSAADTLLAMDNPLNSDIRNLSLERQIKILRRTIDRSFPPTPPATQLLLQRLTTVLVVPMVCLALSLLVLPTEEASVILGRAGLMILSAVTAYGALFGLTHAMITRNTFSLFSSIIVAALVGLAFLVAIAETELQKFGAELTLQELSRGLIGMWLLLIVVPFAAVSVTAMRHRNAAGVILIDVQRALQRRLRRLETAATRTSKPPIGRLVGWAWVAVLVFPFGIVIGRAAAADAELHGHRGVKWAHAASWTCALLVVAAAAAVVITAL